MLTTLLLFALASSSAGSVSASPTPVAVVAPTAAQTPEEGPADKRPEVKELLDTLKAHTDKRGEEDREAITVVDKLLQEFPQSGPKDRADIVKGLGKCFELKRQDLEDGVKNNQLFLACAVALGEMGADATKTLDKYIGNKKLRQDVALQRQLILSLGKTKDPAATKRLIDLLNDDDHVLVGATAETLANFSGAEQKLRKELFNELLKLMMTTKTAKDADANDIVAREKWDVIAAPIITTLQALSGHDERKPEEWQRWWNKNKKEDWDAED
ncbi:MAG: hypothetical protein H6828_09595 [Planctomycetes bacterium]|nr:hypothetical protein [Planctomycetota bacterium]